MGAEIINGTAIAKEKRLEISESVIELIKEGIIPSLVVILIGDDPASHSYVNAKRKACEEVGIKSEVLKYPYNMTEDELLTRIATLNNDNLVHGILVQLPLPKQIDAAKVIEAISPHKDVDGFHPISIGRMMTKQNTFLPCTPYGILHLVKTLQIDITGKHVVVIGISNIVGKPVGQLFLNEDATLTYCHSKTKNLSQLTRLADILVVAIGQPRFIGSEYVKTGAIVIDVGVNRLDTGKLCGDVKFDEVKEIASHITPVPGGVGPMTITMLLYNTVKAAKRDN